jgi:hypothetical protein
MTPETMEFRKLPLGSKIKDFEVAWPDGSKFYTARKMHRAGVILLDGAEKGASVLVAPEHNVTQIERPHEDGDFSYLCNGMHCRCQQ